MPTALSGANGVDLRADSFNEYKKLVKHLHGVSEIPPVGSPPGWLTATADSSDSAAQSAADGVGQDPVQYIEQRRRLPAETEITKNIWTRPRWHIWIRPCEFRKARFQSLEQCRQFMLSSSVQISGNLPYPCVSADSIETGDEWIGAEIDRSHRTERWTLFRSGQFSHNLAIDDPPQLGGRIHVLGVLDIVTAALELASRMARRGVLSPNAAITFELRKVDGLQLTWPQEILGDDNFVKSNCWCQEENFIVKRMMPSDDINTRSREIALQTTLEIYSKFGWSDAPIPRLATEQRQRFGIENTAV
jgi:hypothetical protein